MGRQQYRCMPGQRVFDQEIAQLMLRGELWPLPAALLVDREGGRAELLGAVPTRLEVGRHVPVRAMLAYPGCEKQLSPRARKLFLVNLALLP